MNNNELTTNFIDWAIAEKSSPGKALVLCDSQGIETFIEHSSSTAKRTRDTLERSMPEICSKLIEMECAVAKRVISKFANT